MTLTHADLITQVITYRLLTEILFKLKLINSGNRYFIKIIKISVSSVTPCL